MSLRGIIRRPDRGPLGSEEEVMVRLSEAFPGVQFKYEAEEPPGMAMARGQMSIWLRVWLFILCSIVARGGRFFVVAVLLNRYGDLIRSELEKRLGTWVAIGAAVLVLGFYIAFKLV